MLELAIKAGIPIISVVTTDTVNLQMVLDEIVGEPVRQSVGSPAMLFQKEGTVWWTTQPTPVNEELYLKLAQNDRVLILVNQPEASHIAFNCGVLPTPRKLLHQFLTDITSSTEEAEGLVSCFSGLTIKDLGEVVQLTTARDGMLTPKGVLLTRAMLTSKIQGLQQVDTTMDVYFPYSALEEWVGLNTEFFVDPPDPRLIPRGVLLNGAPGVGKSQGSKYIANAFNVPLYRMDLTAALGRYVGESEANFSRILNVIDQEAPCVMLFDEVEKLFTQSSDQGVTFRILSQLLWWLQEHTSRVFTVLTTNDLAAIPAELYRGRRIDKTFTIQKLDLNEGYKLALKIAGSFKPDMGPADNKVLKRELGSYLTTQEDARVSHAQVTQLTYDLIKKHQWYKPVPLKVGSSLEGTASKNPKAKTI